jgi:hypothetical protein
MIYTAQRVQQWTQTCKHIGHKTAPIPSTAPAAVFVRFLRPARRWVDVVSTATAPYDHDLPDWYATDPPALAEEYPDLIDDKTIAVLQAYILRPPALASDPIWKRNLVWQPEEVWQYDHRRAFQYPERRHTAKYRRILCYTKFTRLLPRAVQVQLLAKSVARRRWAKVRDAVWTRSIAVYWMTLTKHLFAPEAMDMEAELRSALGE